MREVYTDREPARVGYFQSVLESEGIPCFIRNQHTNTTMTGMPSGLFFPVLCVLNDDDFDRAMALLDAAINPPAAEFRPDWQCPECDETVPGTFEICWRCQHERPPEES